MKCFYHGADSDGKCSGAIIKNKHPECEMFPINYGQDFPWSEIIIGETVWMVDFSLNAADMMALDQRAHLIWIDHHVSAIAAVDPNIQGLRQDGIGACALVWDFIFPIKSFPEGRPKSVQLLAEYDVWDHSDPLTLPFQYGIRLLNCDPDSLAWPSILSDDERLEDVIGDGRTILKYIEQSNEIYARSAFETELNGLKCIAINKLYTSSKLFEIVWDPKRYDAMLAFGWRNGAWSVSLYSTDVSVVHVATAHGGGGHAHACGFTCSELPFKLGGDL